MDKILMNQLIRKIAYQYQCDINFSDKCLILQSIKYNFYFYIHLDKLTNDVYRRLFGIEKISIVYEKIIEMLDYSFIDEGNIALFIVEDECLFIDFQNNIMIEWYKFMHFGRCAMTNTISYAVGLLDKQFYEELIEDTVERINEYGKRQYLY